MRFIGIDPGKNGGIGIIDGSLAVAHKLPETQKDTFDLFIDIGYYSGETYALLENVHSSPQMGVTSAYTFGRGVGFLEACMYATGWQWELVSPAKWQKALGCLSKGDKNITKTKASQLFPSIKVNHSIADALLIAEYARRTYKL